MVKPRQSESREEFDEEASEGSFDEDDQGEWIDAEADRNGGEAEEDQAHDENQKEFDFEEDTSAEGVPSAQTVSAET